MMIGSKIHPTNGSKSPKSVLLDKESPFGIGVSAGSPSPDVILHKPQQSAGKRCLVDCQQLYYCVVGPIVHSYKKLSWLTRKTISVMCVVLYIFATVPFRVAFYYDPHSTEATHHWTSELSMFVVLDCVADIIGLIEFVGFYQVWKAAYYELSTMSSLRSGKGRTSDTDRATTAKGMGRRRSSANFQLGRVNWTISSIRQLSSMPGDDANRSRSQKYMSERNFELLRRDLMKSSLSSIAKLKTLYA